MLTTNFPKEEKKVKKIIVVMMVMALMLAVTGCGSRSDFGPSVVVDSVISAAAEVSPLAGVTVSCSASGYTDLTYSWTADAGSFFGSGANVVWVAPDIKGDYKITCEATDAENNSASGSTMISVVPIWKFSGWGDGAGISKVFSAGNSFYLIGASSDNKKLKVEKRPANNLNLVEWTYVAPDVYCIFDHCGGQVEVNADGSVSAYLFGVGDGGLWSLPAYNYHDLNYRVVKLSDSGAVVWNTKQDLVFEDMSMEVPFDLAVSDFVYVVGEDVDYNPVNLHKFRWLKIDKTSGAIIQTVDNIYGMVGSAIAADSQRSYIGGWQSFTDGSIGITAVDDATGTMVWQDITDHIINTISSPQHESNKQVAIYNNELFVAGYVNDLLWSTGTGTRYLNLERRNPVDGSLISAASFAGYAGLTQGMLVDETGVYLAGVTAGYPGNWGVVKFDHNFNEGWKNFYFGFSNIDSKSQQNIATSIARIGNQIYVSGFTQADGWHIKRLSAATGVEE